MDTKNPIVSVLIPVFNGEKYLDETIKSLQNQTFKDFEVVCIDDLSTDNSVKLLQKYASFDERIKIFKRETKGGNAAKGFSYGLPLCKGEWCFCMSQDDFMSSDCLEKCYKRVIETEADVCIPDTVLYLGNAKNIDVVMQAPNEDYSQLMHGCDAFFYSVIYKISGFALKRMSLVHRIGSDDKYYDSSDKSASLHYYYANKVAFCNAKFFYRQNNPDAITKKFSVNNLHHLDTCNEILQFSFEHKLSRNLLQFFIKVFNQRIVSNLCKSLMLDDKQQIVAKTMINNFLSDYRKILKENGYFYSYLKTYCFIFKSKILRIKLYNFMVKYNFTNNFLYKTIHKKLFKT